MFVNAYFNEQLCWNINVVVQLVSVPFLRTLKGNE